MDIIDNVIAYRPQLLPSTEVARYCTYKHTSPVDGTYYGRTYGFEFTIEELDFNRWSGFHRNSGDQYSRGTIIGKALQKYPWNSWKHEVCKTHLFDWECSFVECCGVLESKATGHSYNDAIPQVGGTYTLSRGTKDKIGHSNKLVWGNLSKEERLLRTKHWHKDMSKRTQCQPKKQWSVNGSDELVSLSHDCSSRVYSFWKYHDKPDDFTLDGVSYSRIIDDPNYIRRPLILKQVVDQSEKQSAVITLSNGWSGNKHRLAELFSTELGRNISFYQVGDWIFRPSVNFPKYILSRFPNLKVTSIEYYNAV